jgi:hypothetical protein
VLLSLDDVLVRGEPITPAKAVAQHNRRLLLAPSFIIVIFSLSLCSLCCPVLSLVMYVFIRPILLSVRVCVNEYDSIV